MKKLLLLFLLLSQLAYSQSTLAKETLKQIEINDDPVQSVFTWITDHIKYDVNKRNQIMAGTHSNKKKSFKNEAAYNEHLLQTVLNRKKGVCEDYSLLFHSLMTELGYESFMVSGYLKRKGKLNTKMGHRWNAVKIDGEWKLFDPTWGAGYVKDGKKFVKKYIAEWYDVSPEEMIKTHMPFDPMLQLRNNPISYKDFESNNSSTTSAKPMDYKALINTHLQKGKKEQMQDQVDRSVALGEGIRLIAKWRKVKTNNISTYDIQSQPELIASLSKNSKASVNLFNEYITAKNKRFKSKKWTIPYAKDAMLSVKEQLNETIAGYQSLDVNDKKATTSINKSIRACEQLLKRVDGELEFLDNMK